MGMDEPFEDVVQTVSRKNQGLKGLNSVKSDAPDADPDPAQCRERSFGQVGMQRAKRKRRAKVSFLPGWERA
jgi:hypothetical protein